MTTSRCARLITWDYREQPPMDVLARLLTEVSAGAVHLAQVDTGSDEYAIVLSNQPLTGAEAHAVYEARWESDR